MNGTTLIAAPSIEQIPVAARPMKPSRRASPVEVVAREAASDIGRVKS